MVNIDGKQIKLQIWDTVSVYLVYILCTMLVAENTATHLHVFFTKVTVDA